MQADDDLGPSEEEVLQWMEEEPRAPKRRRRLAVSPRGPFNPVALLMRLPRDLRDFVKTFWTYTRFPLYVAITQEYPDIHAGFNSVFTVSGDAQGLFRYIRRNSGTCPVPLRRRGLTATQVGEAVTAAFRQTHRRGVAATHVVSIYSYCCVKHRAMVVLVQGTRYVFGRARSARRLTEVEEVVARSDRIQLCTSSVARMLTHWSPCTDASTALPMDPLSG